VLEHFKEKDALGTRLEQNNETNVKETGSFLLWTAVSSLWREVNDGVTLLAVVF
jgi:hypothetical protein